MRSEDDALSFKLQHFGAGLRNLLQPKWQFTAKLPKSSKYITKVVYDDMKTSQFLKKKQCLGTKDLGNKSISRVIPIIEELALGWPNF